MDLAILYTHQKITKDEYWSKYCQIEYNEGFTNLPKKNQYKMNETVPYSAKEDSQKTTFETLWLYKSFSGYI